jgi:hypothetical protein
MAMVMKYIPQIPKPHVSLVMKNIPKNHGPWTILGQDSIYMTKDQGLEGFRDFIPW